MKYTLHYGQLDEIYKPDSCFVVFATNTPSGIDYKYTRPLKKYYSLKETRALLIKYNAENKPYCHYHTKIFAKNEILY